MEVPDIPEMTSSKDFAASNFSQVIFPEISDYFSPGKDVRVTYLLTEPMEPSSRDWVGLFKVGWTSAREYLTFVWAPKLCSPQKCDRTFTVTFIAYYLPTDQNEFYQFCYVTKQGHIRGASTPFQFREPSDCDQLIEVEDETGMIVLKTRSAVLQEQLEALNVEKDVLEVKLKELSGKNAQLSSTLSDLLSELDTANLRANGKEEECINLVAELATTRKNLSDVISQLSAAEKEISEQKHELDQAAISISELEEEGLRLKAELAKSKKEHSTEMMVLNEQLDAKVQQFTELEYTVKHMDEKLKECRLKAEDLQQKKENSIEEVRKSTAALKKERDDTQAKVIRYKEEKELFKDQFAHSEEARRDVMQQLTRLKEKMQYKDAEIQEKVEKIIVYEEKTKMLKNELKDVSKQNVVQKTATESELSNLEDKLNACEASKRLISNELTEARDNRDNLMSELHQTKKEKDQVQRDLEASRRQLREMEKNYLALKERAERGEQRFSEMKRKLNDERVFAKERERDLQEQIEILKMHLGSADMAVAAATLSNEKSEISTQTAAAKSDKPLGEQIAGDLKTKENQISDLKLQIEDLRTRLSMGAAAYTEKYVECHKLERRMKKLQNQKSSPKTPTAPHQDSTTSDSQDDSAKNDSTTADATKKSVKDTEAEIQEQQPTGGIFMTKLEQLFMAIADPDVEEQEQSNRLKVRLEELERNVQFEHSKYRKYKNLYQDEKLSHAADDEKFRTEAFSLKIKLDELKNSMEPLQHENEALKEQLKEFVRNSNDENVVKTRESIGIDVPLPPADASMSRYGNPYQQESNRSSRTTYPHESLFSGNEIDSQNTFSSESDMSDDFQLTSTRFGTLGLCPKNQKSDLSDLQNASCSAVDTMVPASGVIKRQPTRSPPLIEVISSEGDGGVSGSPTSSSDKGVAVARRRRGTKSKKYKGKRDFA